MAGEIEVTVEGDPNPYWLGPTGLISVTAGRYYELKNKTDLDVILSFSRELVSSQ